MINSPKSKSYSIFKKILVYVLYLIAVLFCFGILLASMNRGITITDKILSIILGLIIITFVVIIPYILIKNSFGIRTKLPLFKNNTKSSIIGGTIITAIFIFIMISVASAITSSAFSPQYKEVMKSERDRQLKNSEINKAEAEAIKAAKAKQTNEENKIKEVTKSAVESIKATDIQKSVEEATKSAVAQSNNTIVEEQVEESQILNAVREPVKTDNLYSYNTQDLLKELGIEFAKVQGFYSGEMLYAAISNDLLFTIFIRENVSDSEFIGASLFLDLSRGKTINEQFGTRLLYLQLFYPQNKNIINTLKKELAGFDNAYNKGENKKQKYTYSDSELIIELESDQIIITCKRNGYLD